MEWDSQDGLCGDQKTEETVNADAIKNQEVEQEGASEAENCDPNHESGTGLVEVEDKKNVW